MLAEMRYVTRKTDPIIFFHLYLTHLESLMNFTNFLIVSLTVNPHLSPHTVTHCIELKDDSA